MIRAGGGDIGEVLRLLSLEGIRSDSAYDSPHRRRRKRDVEKDLGFRQVRFSYLTFSRVTKSVKVGFH